MVNRQHVIAEINSLPDGMINKIMNFINQQKMVLEINNLTNIECNPRALFMPTGEKPMVLGVWEGLATIPDDFNEPEYP